MGFFFNAKILRKGNAIIKNRRHHYGKNFSIRTN